MHNPFNQGDKKIFRHIVKQEDTVHFTAENLHPVYSTYALTRDAEWVCRLFVLQMKDDDEEGIGTQINVIHHSPVKVGGEVFFTGILKAVNKNEVLCSFEAYCGERLVASGETAQKILRKEKLETLFNSI